MDNITYLSYKFNELAGKIGQFYAKLALRTPCGCIALGFIICLLLSIPFFWQTDNGLRSPQNRGKGFVFRADLQVWLPHEALTLRHRAKIEKVDKASYGHGIDFGNTTFRGRAKDKTIDEQFDRQCAGEEGGTETLVWTFRSEERELCKNSQMEALYHFDQHVKKFEVHFEGQQIRFTMDICVINNRLEVEETNQKYMHPCGFYQGEDIGLEPCRLAFFDDKCRSEVGVCQDWDLERKGCDQTRFEPGGGKRATRWCYIGKESPSGDRNPKYEDVCASMDENAQGHRYSTICSDAKSHTEDDGTILWWSEIACQKEITGRPWVIGSFYDQAPEEMWCSTRSTLSYLGVLDHFLENNFLSTADRLDDLKLITQGFQGNDAMICYSEAGALCIDWEGGDTKRSLSPYSGLPYLLNFQSEYIAAFYLNSIFLTGTIKDVRKLKNCPMVQTAVCPDTQVPTPVPVEVVVSDGCTDNDAELLTTLKSLGVDSEVTCAQAANIGWCKNLLGSTCLNVRNACPMSCRNVDYPGCSPPSTGSNGGQSDSGAGGQAAPPQAERSGPYKCYPLPVPPILPEYMNCECDYPNYPWELRNPEGPHLYQNYVMDDCETMVFLYVLRKECNLNSPTVNKIKGYGDRKWVDCSYNDTQFCGCRGDAGCRDECRKKSNKPNAFDPCDETDALGDCECPAMQLERCEINRDKCGVPDQCKNLRSEPCGEADEMCLCPAFSILQLKHRKKWASKIMEEVQEGYQSGESGREISNMRTEIPKKNNFYRTLYDQGIDVGFVSADYVGVEVGRVVVAESDPLIGTFFLMIAFLSASICIKEWNGCVPVIHYKRILLSLLVIVQPILAMMVSWGVGFIPMWQVPGDVDLDGHEDKVIALTALTPFSMHLMLAIIVDLDIIMVRAFDRTSPDQPFDKRLQISIGRCHRTILISTVTGLMAYALGSIVKVEILIFFCWHAFLGYIGLYISLFTVFLGAFILSERGSEDKDSPTMIISEMNVASMELPNMRCASDIRFANFLMHPVISASVVLLELVLAILSVVYIGDITMDVDTMEYFLPDSLLIRFLKHAVDAGGMTQTMSLWMPESKVGQYHKQANRDYYFTRFNEIRALDSVTPVGYPGTNSWIHDFEMWHRGGIDFEVAPVPPEDFFTWWSVPYGDACPIDYTLSFHVTSTFTSSGEGNLAGSSITPRAAITLDELFQKITLRRKFIFHTGEKKWYGEKIVLEIAEIVKPSIHPGHHDNIILTQDPRTPGERLRNYNSVQALKEFLETQFPFIIRFRDQVESKYAPIPNLSMTLMQCNIHRSYYSQRVKHHEENPDDFYEYLHDWFYDSNHSSDDCVTSGLNQGMTRMSKANKYKKLSEDVGKCGLLVPSPFLQRFTQITATTNSINIKTAEVRVSCANECDMYLPKSDEGECKAYSIGPDSEFCVLHLLGKKEKVNPIKPFTECADCSSYYCYVRVSLPHSSRFYNENGNRIQWIYDNSTLHVTGIAETYLQTFANFDSNNMPFAVKQRDETLDKIKEWRATNPERWPEENPDDPGMNLFVYADAFRTVEKDEKIVGVVVNHFLKVGIAVVISCVLFLHPFYGIAVGFFLALINAQVLGIMGMTGLALDSLCFGALAMAIGFGIEYVVHIAHSFIHKKSRGMQRARECLEDMGITVFNAFLSTALQQFVFLLFASTAAFRRYCTIMLIIIVKSGITGFLFVPLVLGFLDELVYRFQPNSDDKKEMKTIVVAEK